MKNLLILLTVLLVLGSACKKDFLSVNEKNPNTASSVPASLILPSALNNTSILMNNPGNLAWIYEWYGCWSISGGYSQDVNMTQYNVLNSSFQAIWNNSYINLQNYDYIEKNSTTPALRSYRAIAKIMKAYIYHNLVDTYGDIPYTEALKTDAGILKPKYDPQQDVYEKLVIELDTAMNLIATTPVDAEALGSKDIIFGGNMAKWARFANTIKLKMLVNQSAISGRDTYIKAAIATTASVGYLGASEGAWANPGYLQSTGKMAPFWERFYSATGSQQSDGLGFYVAGGDACDFLNANADPRKLRVFQPYSGTSIAGNYFGATVLLTVPTTSKLGFGMLQGYGQSSPILTEMESQFIQAEAAQRGYISGSAKTFYEAGVTASVVYMGKKSSLDASTYTPLTSGDAATYLAQAKNLVGFDASTNKIQAILTQKWLALNGLSAMPIWTDIRRSGFPDFIHWSADPNKKNPTPPIRLLYPQTEVSTNNDNVVASGVSSSNDVFTKNIFWDKN